MTASPPRPHKVHRRRAARVGMPAKTSKRNPSLRPTLTTASRARSCCTRFGPGKSDRPTFSRRGRFRAEFQHYDARTDNLALTYPEDGDEEVVPFDNLMNPERTMWLSADAEAAVVLMACNRC